MIRFLHIFCISETGAQEDLLTLFLVGKYQEGIFEMLEKKTLGTSRGMHMPNFCLMIKMEIKFFKCSK